MESREERRERMRDALVVVIRRMTQPGGERWRELQDAVRQELRHPGSAEFDYAIRLIATDARQWYREHEGMMTIPAMNDAAKVYRETIRQEIAAGGWSRLAGTMRQESAI